MSFIEDLINGFNLKKDDNTEQITTPKHGTVRNKQDVSTRGNVAHGDSVYPNQYEHSVENSIQGSPEWPYGQIVEQNPQAVAPATGKEVCPSVQSFCKGPKFPNNPVGKNSKAGTHENGLFASKNYVYKKLVKVKLTIVLLEKPDANVALISKVLPKMVKDGNVILITYGDKVEITDMIPATEMNVTNFFTEEIPTGTCCLYDALMCIDGIMKKHRFTFTETDTERLMIDSFEILGIGTCSENGSTATKEEALKQFASVLKDDCIVSKYYCLTDKDVINAARVGFRSIGALSTNY